MVASRTILTGLSAEHFLRAMGKKSVPHPSVHLRLCEERAVSADRSRSDSFCGRVSGCAEPLCPIGPEAAGGCADQGNAALIGSEQSEFYRRDRYRRNDRDEQVGMMRRAGSWQEKRSSSLLYCEADVGRFCLRPRNSRGDWREQHQSDCGMVLLPPWT